MAVKPSKLSSRKRSALELNSMPPAEVERATSTRVRAGFGIPGPAARDTLDGDEQSVRIRIPTGLVRPQLLRKCCTRHRDTRPIAYGVDVVLQRADEPHLREQQPEAELEREEDQTLSTSSLTLCSTKAFSEHLPETTLAFVEVLGHNVMMLHSDPEPVLVQLSKAVQNRRFERTSVRHGPRTSHQSQSRIGNVNQVTTTLEIFLREKLSNDNILLAWPIRHAAWNLTKFQVKNDGRTAFLRVSREAYTTQLPFGERVMHEHTAVPTDNLNQRWGHGIWIGEAPMTDECIIPSENVVQKAKSLHRVTTKEKFLISELENLERSGRELEVSD